MFRASSHRLFTGVLLACAITAGCDGLPAHPTPPPAPPAQNAIAKITVSGVITELTEAGESPLQGVAVTDSVTFTTVYSNAAGAYRLAVPGQTKLLIWMGKPAYDTVTTDVTSNTDIQLDARMKRYSASALSGMAYEMTPTGRVPLSGVVLYCEYCGLAPGDSFVTTGADGLYRFPGMRNGQNWIDAVDKAGYRYAGLTELGSIPVFIDGDTKLDLEFIKK